MGDYSVEIEEGKSVEDNQEEILRAGRIER